MIRRIFFLLALLPATLALAADKPAYPFADRVPPGALLYLAWQGADQIDISKTHLQALLNESRIKEVFTDFAPAAIKKFAAKNDPFADAHINMVLALEGILWHHPTAAFISEFTLDPSPDGQPQPNVKGAILCDAGDDAANLMQMLQTIEQFRTKTTTPLHITQDGNVVCCAFGYADTDKILAAADSLLTSPEFKSAAAQISVHPAYAAFFNVSQILSTISSLGALDADQRDLANKIIDTTGLKSVRSFTAAAGFDGTDWSAQSFLAAPSPRTGLLAGFDNTPLDQNILKRVPTTATQVAAAHVDLAAFTQRLLDTITQVNPSAGQMAHQLLGAAQMMTAVRPIDDILKPLGPDWALYFSTDTAGVSFTSPIAVNKLRDPATAQTKFLTLQTSLCNLASAAMASKEMMISAGSITSANTAVNYFDTPLVSPAWAIQDGYLYLGLYPQSVAVALRRPMDKSILDNPEFQSAIKRLGDHQPVGLTFNDLPRTSGLVYSLLLMYERAGAGIAAMFGLPIAEPVLPPYDTILANLAPAASITWADDDGIHCADQSPFPGSEFLGSGAQMLMTTPVMMASAFTGMLHEKQSAQLSAQVSNQGVTMTREHALGLYITKYADAHNNQFPPDLGTLLLDQKVPAVNFLVPASGTTLPHGFKNMPDDQRAQWINDHTDFTYVGKDLTAQAATQQTVVLYEKSQHQPDGMGILFADGHVEFVTPDRARELTQH